MKIKYIYLIILSLFFAVGANSQHLLYFESFEASNDFTLNDTIYGVNRGNNMWIVNNTYTGGVGYPATISEDSTFGGSITDPNTPTHGHYLHIYDSASGYLNDNYRRGDSSTRFAHMAGGVCTKSLYTISLNFYYLCQGSANDYGVIFYSVNGGAWLPSGDTLKNKRYKWQYYTAAPNPAYSNVDNLRFGFLWHNDKTTGTDTLALGLDDISIYGTYDSINHPITCTFTNYFSDSCLGGNAYVYFSATINDSTCNAIWDVDMTAGNGTGSGGLAWYQTVADSLGNDINTYWFLEPPATYTVVGQCYKFKLVQTTYPYLSFLDSMCFPFDTCPGTITTIQPPATNGDTVCAGSVIDVGFYSSGLYDPTNEYFATLIDSTGYHTATIDTIGDLYSSTAYAYPPGDIISVIPDTVPAGCRYYVQVVCNTGNRKPYMWGPFCIQHCDLLTNNQQSLQVCLHSCSKEPHGYYDTISYNVHEYDSLAKYYPGNKFEVQLISFSVPYDLFTVVNTGLLGLVVDTAAGKMLLHVPCPDTLNLYGITPGIYYARIIADSSSFPDSALGTLIHLTIGEPADSMYLTVTSTPPGPPYCQGLTIVITALPNNSAQPVPGSTYTWWQTDKTNGTYQFPNLTTDPAAFNPNPDTLIYTCQENSFGCLGGKASVPDTIIILGKPSITKTGPTVLCLSDTGTYSIPYADNTVYVWTLPTNTHADTSNNILKIKFDSAGTFTVSVVALNECYSNTASWTIKVYKNPVPVITATPPGAVCSGDSVTLSVSGATTYKWSTGKATTSINIKTSVTDTVYWVKGSNPACFAYDTINLSVIPLPNISITPSPAAACFGDTTSLKASGANTYQWTPNTGITKNMDSIVKVVVTADQTYTVIGTGTGGCKDTVDATVNLLTPSGTVSTAEAIHEGSTVTLTAGGGSSYLWTPSSGLSCDTCENTVATPSVTTTYSVVITDPNGCRLTDTVTIDVIPTCGIFVPNAFAPNNPTNLNTILYVRSECLVSMDFIVYDRWGNKVFESKDLGLGWDGTFKGQPMNEGTFVYYVTGTTTDGKTLSLKGNVTLVR